MCVVLKSFCVKAHSWYSQIENNCTAAFSDHSTCTVPVAKMQRYVTILLVTYSLNELCVKAGQLIQARVWVMQYMSNTCVYVP